MNKKSWILLSNIVLIICAVIVIIIFRPNKKRNEYILKDLEQTSEINDSEEAIEMNTSDEIYIQDTDGRGTNYIFKYDGKEYQAIYTNDNWHIINSFEITDENDISKICQALINIHPIHGKDMTSYRAVEDLTFEWMQHNLAYNLLPEDNPWRENAKDVDLDPADQGRTISELYESRTGKEFNINDFK